MDQPSCKALSLCSADADMYLPLLCLFLLLQSMFALKRITNQKCLEYGKPATYMKADIILGAFIPIYVAKEEPKEIPIFFQTKQHPLSVGLM